MERNVAQLGLFERAWAWFETNKTPALAGAAIVIVAGVAVAFYLAQQGEKEVSASEDLSKVMAPLTISGGNRNETADAYLKVAADHPGTAAAGRAALQAAAVLFTQSKYPEAQAQFEKFVRENPESPFRGQAQLGAAACLDAQGKKDDAARAYKDLADRHPSENVVPQAKFALARIYESQNKLAEAYNLYEQVAQADVVGSIGEEAALHAEQLKMELSSRAPAFTPVPLTKAPPASSRLESTNAR